MDCYFFFSLFKVKALTVNFFGILTIIEFTRIGKEIIQINIFFGDILFSFFLLFVFFCLLLFGLMKWSEQLRIVDDGNDLFTIIFNFFCGSVCSWSSGDYGYAFFWLKTYCAPVLRTKSLVCSYLEVFQDSMCVFCSHAQLAVYSMFNANTLRYDNTIHFGSIKWIMVWSKPLMIIWGFVLMLLMKILKNVQKKETKSWFFSCKVKVYFIFFCSSVFQMPKPPPTKTAKRIIWK